MDQDWYVERLEGDPWNPLNPSARHQEREDRGGVTLDEADRDDILGDLVEVGALPHANGPRFALDNHPTPIIHSGGDSNRRSPPASRPRATRSIMSAHSISTYYTAQSSVLSYATAPESVNALGNLMKKGRVTSDSKAESSNNYTERVVSSDWLPYLAERGILLDPSVELDWSGRGQHVEYEPHEENAIPLRVEKILGHSATAIVDSVMCRRIRLARKRIRCNRRLSKQEAISEVEHLQRLQHRHILRVVGSYTLRNDLCILLYPATEWNLEEYLDTLVESEDPNTWLPRVRLPRFFGCLSAAMHYLNSMNIKHMDIKPKNLLVRRDPDINILYRIYIADFGIARSYKSAAESETDSPTPFTRTYAAPEVVLQDKRGYAADIFSLGCVFMEMVAVMTSTSKINERDLLHSMLRSNEYDTSYQANIVAVLVWFKEKRHLLEGTACTKLVDLLPRMLAEDGMARPTATELFTALGNLGCGFCDNGPEPFQAASSNALPVGFHAGYYV